MCLDRWDFFVLTMYEYTRQTVYNHSLTIRRHEIPLINNYSMNLDLYII
jgi:hypothetical protein